MLQDSEDEPRMEGTSDQSCPNLSLIQPHLWPPKPFQLGQQEPEAKKHTLLAGNANGPSQTPSQLTPLCLLCREGWCPWPPPQRPV